MVLNWVIKEGSLIENLAKRNGLPWEGHPWLSVRLGQGTWARDRKQGLSALPVSLWNFLLTTKLCLASISTSQDSLPARYVNYVKPSFYRKADQLIKFIMTYSRTLSSLILHNLAPSHNTKPGQLLLGTCAPALPFRDIIYFSSHSNPKW